jgi:protein-disulfide isomerase
MSTPLTPTAHDQKQGPADAPHTLIEYGDYQCPACGQAAPAVQKLIEQMGDQLQFIFRNYPLDQHEFAEPAAATALFAAEHGKFWEMHDLLYKHQAEFSEALFRKLTKQLGMDPAALTEALQAKKYSKQIKSENASGDQAGVPGTPSFFLDGKPYQGEIDADSLLVKDNR